MTKGSGKGGGRGRGRMRRWRGRRIWWPCIWPCFILKLCKKTMNLPKKTDHLHELVRKFYKSSKRSWKFSQYFANLRLLTIFLNKRYDPFYRCWTFHHLSFGLPFSSMIPKTFMKWEQLGLKKECLECLLLCIEIKVIKSKSKKGIIERRPFFSKS